MFTPMPNQQVVRTDIYAAGGNLVGYYEYTYQNGKTLEKDAYFRFPGGAIPVPILLYDMRTNTTPVAT
jgi:hypothetical protein